MHYFETHIQAQSCKASYCFVFLHCQSPCFRLSQNGCWGRGQRDTRRKKSVTPKTWGWGILGGDNVKRPTIFILLYGNFLYILFQYFVLNNDFSEVFRKKLSETISHHWLLKRFKWVCRVYILSLKYLKCKAGFLCSHISGVNCAVPY